MTSHDHKQEALDWGIQLNKLYAEELELNTEDELWVNQKPTYIEAPADEESEKDIEDSYWGKELARIYEEDL